MYTRDRSRPAGSEARGEGRERGNLVETTSKPPDAQRAGGIRGSGSALAAEATFAVSRVVSPPSQPVKIPCTMADA